MFYFFFKQLDGDVKCNVVPTYIETATICKSFYATWQKLSSILNNKF